ncbi:translation initiation factor IF-3, partial [Micrococcus sp. SIMBA_144]
MRVRRSAARARRGRPPGRPLTARPRLRHTGPRPVPAPTPPNRSSMTDAPETAAPAAPPRLIATPAGAAPRH